MNYLRANDYNFSRPRGPGWTKPVLLALTVLLLYIWGAGLLAGIFSVITYPFLRWSGAVSAGWSDVWRTRANLTAENDRLTREVTRLKAEAGGLATLRAENEQLRGFKNAGLVVKKPVYARVLVRPDHLPYDEIIIDAGLTADPKLAVGQLVFVEEGIVLGQIDQVTAEFSKVRLYSESGVSLPVAVGETGQPSVALGLGAGNFSLSLPRGVTIKVGDAVRTTIIGNYLLGYVGLIDKNPNDPFQKIQFRSPVSFFNLNWVFVSHD